MRISRLFLSVLLIVVLGTTAMAASYLWVSSANTELKDKPSANGKTVLSLKRNERVSLLKKSGRWFQVKSSRGKAGWVYRGRVTNVQPAGKRNSAAGRGLFGDPSSTITADRATSDRAMRGLTPGAEAYSKKTGTSERYARELDRMLDRTFTAQDVEEFLKRGKIGEYAQ